MQLSQISSAIQNYWELEKGWIEKKHAKSLHWGDFTSWANNEKKERLQYKRYQFFGNGFYLWRSWQRVYNVVKRRYEVNAKIE